MQKFPIKLPLILSGIFLLSVLIRIPTLNRPLSKHHEFCTAHALRVLEVWDEYGIRNFHFAPVMNYQNNGDKGINNQASTSGLMLDEERNYYYISHPPLAYYLPYVVFKILHVKPTALALEIFNLVFHFITAVFVFLIAQILARHPNSSGSLNSISLIPLFSFTAYCFTPATLWFHSNVYMSDMFVQVFFAMSLFLFLKYFLPEGKVNSKRLSVFSLSVFLMCYTTWFGYFVIAGFVLFALRSGKLKSRKWNEVILLSASAGVLALCLVAFQYGSLNGERAFLKELTARFAERDSLNQNFFFSLKSLVVNYVTSYLPFLGFGFAAYWFLRYSKKICPVFTQAQIRFFILSLVPVILLHLFLLNYSGHDFTTLYASIPLVIGCAILFEKLMVYYSRKMIYALGGIILVISVCQFWLINPPGKMSIKGDPYDYYQKQGKFIAQESSPEEMIFLLEQKPETQLIYYAKRNIQFIDSLPQAYGFLEKSPVRKGVVFSGKDFYTDYVFVQRIGIQ